MSYQVYFVNSPRSHYETIEATNFRVDQQMVIFSWDNLPGFPTGMNIACYPQASVAKVIYVNPETMAQKRARKLHRILSRSWWQKLIFWAWKS